MAQLSCKFMPCVWHKCGFLLLLLLLLHNAPESTLPTDIPLLLQDLHAPGMESLRYKRSLAIRLPFQGLTKLAELSYLGQRLQPHELAANLLLERLTLGYTLSTVTAAYVSSLAPLQSLRELRIHFFRSSGGQETLEPFAALGRSVPPPDSLLSLRAPCCALHLGCFRVC